MTQPSNGGRGWRGTMRRGAACPVRLVRRRLDLAGGLGEARPLRWSGGDVVFVMELAVGCPLAPAYRLLLNPPQRRRWVEGNHRQASRFQVANKRGAHSGRWGGVLWPGTLFEMPNTIRYALQ